MSRIFGRFQAFRISSIAFRERDPGGLDRVVVKQQIGAERVSRADAEVMVALANRIDPRVAEIGSCGFQVLATKTLPHRIRQGGRGEAGQNRFGQLGCHKVKTAAIEVEDDGKGMTAADRERALEPFFTTRPEGMGLGLAVVRSIVADLGGAMDIRSHPGQGSCFRVSLPLADEEAS